MKQKILQKSMCHRYSTESKDVFHAPWGCEKLQSVWATNFGWVDRTRMQSSSFPEVVNLIREKPQLVPLFVVATWSVWYQQNKLACKNTLCHWTEIRPLHNSTFRTSII